MTFDGSPGSGNRQGTGNPDTPSWTQEPKRPKADPWTVILGIIGGALVGTGVTLGVLGATGVFEEPPLPTAPTLPPAPTLTVPQAAGAPPIVLNPGVTSEVASRAMPSIVAVETTSFLSAGSGSGVVYGTDGYVITNHHVIDGASEVSVVFADGARYPAQIIGSDPLTDIAVLRVARPDMTPIDIGSSGMAIGDGAIAVGNPLALLGGPSVTSGIVSALGRSLELENGNILYGLIQTDAPITRGSSGGALLDISARLIGITTAIAVSDVGAEGLGFAIPVDMATAVANDLIETGTVEHALIGISGKTAFAQDGAASYPVGILVEEILRDSPYSAAGGQVNDVITSMDAQSVFNLTDLLTQLRKHRAGDEVTVAILRADSKLDLIVVLGRLGS